MTANMKPFCSICVGYIGADEIKRRGVVREPIGKGGAMVVVCERCAKEEAKVIDAAVHIEPGDEHIRIPNFAAQKRRQGNVKAGLCRNASFHGKATHGQLCRYCAQKQKDYKERVRRSA